MLLILYIGRLVAKYCAQFWDLLEGKELFPFGDDTQDDDFKHLSHITALLGPPPQELIRCGRRSSNFYRSDGQFLCPCIYILPILIVRQVLSRTQIWYQRTSILIPLTITSTAKTNGYSQIL